MRRRSIALNTAANLASQLVSLGLGFVLPALIISRYGSAANGLVSSVKQVMTHLLLVEAGVGAASVAALYGPLRTEDRGAVSGILAATRRFLRWSALLYAVALGAVVFWFAVGVPPVPGVPSPALLLLAICVAGAWELSAVGVHRVAVLAENRAYFITAVETALNAIGGILAIVMLRRGIDLVLVFGVVTAVRASEWIVLALSERRRFPWLDLRARPHTAAIAARWSALVHQLASAAIFSSPVIILASFTNFAEVSVFSVHYLVMAGVVSLVGIFSNGLAHGFGVAYSESVEMAARLFRIYEFCVYPLILVGFGCAAVLFVPFMRLYSAPFHDVVYVRPELALGFVFVGLFNSIRVPANLLVTGAGHFRQTQWRAVLEMVLNVGLMLIFAPLVGIWAFVISGVISFGYRSIDLIVYANRVVLGRAMLPSFLVIARNSIAVGLAAWLCVSVLDFQARTYVDLVILCLATLLVLTSAVVLVNAIFDGRRLRALFARKSL